MKIQQTAFMLVALVIFFSMAGLIYFSISIANMRERASQLYEKEALETVKMLSGTPELIFTQGGNSPCSACIDFYKAFELSQNPDLAKELWNFDHLEIEIVYPPRTQGQICNPSNLNTCQRIILIQRGQQKPKTAFATMVRYDQGKQNYVYELVKIHATPKNITR